MEYESIRLHFLPYIYLWIIFIRFHWASREMERQWRWWCKHCFFCLTMLYTSKSGSEFALWYYHTLLSFSHKKNLILSLYFWLIGLDYCWYILFDTFPVLCSFMLADYCSRSAVYNRSWDHSGLDCQCWVKWALFALPFTAVKLEKDLLVGGKPHCQKYPNLPPPVI